MLSERYTGEVYKITCPNCRCWRLSYRPEDAERAASGCSKCRRARQLNEIASLRAQLEEAQARLDDAAKGEEKP